MDGINNPSPAAPPGAFDFTSHMHRLCTDMVGRLDELRHIQLDQVGIRFCQTRKAVRHGIQATLTPLRFEGGSRLTKKRERTWTIQQVHDSAGRELLYLLSFYLPRYMNQPFREKLETVLHELWHIGPAFDGDLRRHPGRCYAHSGSQRSYDATIAALTDRWLSLGPDENLYSFLRFNFRQLVRKYTAVCGVKIPTPKLIPLPLLAGKPRLQESG